MVRVMQPRGGPDDSAGLFTRLFWDPLVLTAGDGVPAIHTVPARADGDGLSWPRLDELTGGAAPDLVVITQGEYQRLSAEATMRLVTFVERGGALLAVQPTDDSGDFPE